MLKVQQEQQAQQQRAYQPTAPFSSMGQPSLHLPHIQNSILQATLPTPSLSASAQIPSTANVDLPTLQSSLNQLQNYSNRQPTGAVGSTLAAPGFLQQVQQQLLINLILGGGGQPLPGVAVSLSESGNENQEDSANDETSSELQ
eukprot:scaffold25829_cov117-Cylindrotheca_fusiformis.AAC.2